MVWFVVDYVRVVYYFEQVFVGKGVVVVLLCEVYQVGGVVVDVDDYCWIF